MKIKVHVLASFIIAFLIFLITKNAIYFSLVFLSGILMDADHVLYFVLKNRRFNLVENYRWCLGRLEDFKKGNFQKPCPFIFHSVEFLILIFILSIIYNPLFFLLIGFASHMILDIISFLYHSNFNIRLMPRYIILTLMILKTQKFK